METLENVGDLSGRTDELLNVNKDENLERE
jgi:hypothetical protein